MKTIFLGEAASCSGSLGFSEAWPLSLLVLEVGQMLLAYHPAQTASTFINSAFSTIKSTLAKLLLFVPPGT